MSTDVARGRSPRYPRISLTEAIRHINTLYRGAHRSVMDTNTAYRVLGYAGKTGASATVLGALRQYSLVSGLRGDVAVSDLALRILEPSSRTEYAEAVVEAANAPEAFRAIDIHFSGNIPNSDEPIRAFLIRTLGFSRSGAEECIKSFRETYSEARAQSGLVDADTERTEGEIAVVAQPGPPSHEHPAPQHVSAATNATHVSELVRVPLSRECTAEIRFEGSVTREAIDRLIGYINLMKPIWAGD